MVPILLSFCCLKDTRFTASLDDHHLSIPRVLTIFTVTVMRFVELSVESFFFFNNFGDVRLK